jgi:hypothetical protein
MRTCASCGKANNPIRKYCTRCGKPLIQTSEEKAAPIPTSVVTQTPIPDVKTTASVPTNQYIPSDTAKATTDDEWVRPSQVSRDRVRSGSSSSGKSEMEKAREAFAKAEGVGIDEADGSGIVETRMLRASEVRELMGEGAAITEDTPPPIQPTPSAIPTPTPTHTTNPTHTPSLPQSGSLQDATPPASSGVPSGGLPSQPAAMVSTTSDVQPPPAVHTPAPAAIPTPPAATPSSTSPPSIPVKPPMPAPIATSSSSISLDTRVPEIEEILSKVTEPEDLQDSKIKDLVASLTTQHAELRKVKEDFDNVSSRLDEFVRSCKNDAEVKRIHYESLCEQERFAKQEYESSKKEYERVDKRRKKEVSSLEDKVKNVEKNIAKSKDALQKRIVELDKERAKIAQLQSDGQ